MSYFMKLTEVGAGKVAAAHVVGQSITLAQMSVGDGNGAPVGEPTGAETDLARSVYTGAIDALYLGQTDSTTFVAELSIPAINGGWFVREVGVFTSDGQLFAYGNFPETYKPTASEGSVREMVVVAAFRVQHASVINLVVDTSIVMASRQWVLANMTAANILPGGQTGQLLAKKSAMDGDVIWVDPERRRSYYFGQI